MLDELYVGCPLPKWYFGRSGTHPRAGTPRELCDWIGERVGPEGGEVELWVFRYAAVERALRWGHVMTSILPSAAMDTLLALGIERIFHSSTFALVAQPPSQDRALPSVEELGLCRTPIATAVAWYVIREGLSLDRVPTEEELRRTRDEVAANDGALSAAVSTVVIAAGPAPSERLMNALRRESLLAYQPVPWPSRLMC